MVKVSVILPIDDVKYLDECLNSLINQYLEDIEIICVDCQVTNDSIKLLNHYSKIDNRIRIVNNKNGYVSDSKNLGITLSKGEYIYFFNPNCFLELNALNELYNISKQNHYDLVMFKLINFNNQTYEKFTSDKYEMKFFNKYKNKLVNLKELGDEIFNIDASSQSKFFKRDLISNLRFAEGKIFEDILFFSNVILENKNLFFYDKYLCNHRFDKRLIDNSDYDNKCDDILDIFNKLIYLTRKFEVYEIYKNKLFEMKMENTFSLFCNVRDIYKEKFFNKIKKDFKSINFEYEDNSISHRSKFIYLSGLNSKSYKEFYYKIKLFDCDDEISRLKKEELSLNNKITKINQSNENILSSTNWKVTKPLRRLMNLFR